MNQIHEDDWSDSNWSRHSGMPNDDSDKEVQPEEKVTIAPRGTIVVPPHLKKLLK